jgi:hypothetical protein
VNRLWVIRLGVYIDFYACKMVGDRYPQYMSMLGIVTPKIGLSHVDFAWHAGNAIINTRPKER